MYAMDPMTKEIRHLFESFELFEDEKLMKGFIRVATLTLDRADKILNSPDYGFDQPFDARFGKMMVKTGAHLLGAFGEVVYGFIHGEEIDVLLASVEESGPPPDGREIICRFSSESSGKMTLMLGEPVSFGVKLYEFPAPDVVKKFFVWRQKTKKSEALDRYVKVALLANGTDLERISEKIQNLGDHEKIEVLRQQDISFSEVPGWQTRGVGLYWQAGVDDSEPSLMVELKLPAENDFDKYLGRFL